MCVQHVVNAVEVEIHIIQEKINQETKRIEVPPLQFMDKSVDIPVVAQRQAHMNQMVQKTIVVVDVPVVLVVQIPLVQVVAETIEIPREKIDETPEFDAGAGENPFTKVKSLISNRTCRDERMSKTTEKKDNLDANTGKHSSTHETAVSRSTEADRVCEQRSS